MAAQRSIPWNTDWLRQYLARLGVVIPLSAEGDEVADICAKLPAPQWRAVRNAWQQRQHRREPQWKRGLNAAFTDGKHLGAVWERLISMDCVTREDALTMAELGYGGGIKAYSDPMARELVATCIRIQADAMRNKDPMRKAVNLDLVRKAIEQFGYTDPIALHKATGIPLPDCMEGFRV